MSREKMFNKAANHLQSLASELSATELLRFYALYKQATVGPCNALKPKWYQVQAKQKWEAWNSLNEMSSEDAMNNYIEELAKLNPNWEEDAQSESGGWVAISRLINTEEEISDNDKTFLDWVKDGQEEKVQELLGNEPELVNLRDEEGLLPIHWAADRGHLRITEELVKRQANVNSQDEDGQTPLHYAASCGHTDVVKYLLSIGARSMKDNSGMTPKDVAEEHLKDIL
ncbi:acyl-CoA-binding domain-containing protein 6 [Ceratina calcarata]|uniref:Acyl-CoA-binding domain-containing protein 6 n=1 Tax=Ceratina calcarata TaxID=156304 RepID=A0AAJ7N5U2_9HYME|nr:acyl-CoA-binding domain-containing protein 6 [Ceratina calcarata]